MRTDEKTGCYRGQTECIHGAERKVQHHAPRPASSSAQQGATMVAQPRVLSAEEQETRRTTHSRRRSAAHLCPVRSFAMSETHKKTILSTHILKHSHSHSHASALFFLIPGFLSDSARRRGGRWLGLWRSRRTVACDQLGRESRSTSVILYPTPARRLGGDLHTTVCTSMSPPIRSCLACQKANIKSARHSPLSLSLSPIS